jgi:hypothetical protein
MSDQETKGGMIEVPADVEVFAPDNREIYETDVEEFIPSNKDVYEIVPYVSAPFRPLNEKLVSLT